MAAQAAIHEISWKRDFYSALIKFVDARLRGHDA
jgi:hypothetical protein